jgi:hypothetical protein
MASMKKFLSILLVFIFASVLSACFTQGEDNTLPGSDQKSDQPQSSTQNNIPVALSDSVSTDQNVAIQINVLANDSSLEDGPVTLAIVNNPNNGNVQINTDNSITYNPVTDYYGSDTFSYRVTDNNGDSALATVSLTIRCVNNCNAVVPGNTYYVRAGASGNGSGTDWSNAFNQLPDSLIRGATYLVADGSYPGRTFSDPASGTSQIQIRKATAADHGTNAGWSDAYGDGQAEFGPLNFQAEYYTLDGVAPYGFKVVGGYRGTLINILNTARHIHIKHVDADGNFTLTNGYQTDGACSGIEIKGSDITIEASDIHNIADDGIVIVGNQIRILSSKIHKLHGCGTDGGCGPCFNGHSDGFELQNTTDVEISGSMVYDIKSTSALITGQYAAGTYTRNLTLTNNIFYTPDTGITVYLYYVQGARVYNNIIWGRTQGTRFGGLAIGPEVTNLDMKNNIILNINYNHLGGSYNPAEHDIDYNLFAMVDPGEYTPNTHDLVGNPQFAMIPVSSDSSQHIRDNLTAVNFTLLPMSPALDAGISLPGLVDIDLIGNVRPQDGNGDGIAVWDMGALEVTQ